MNNKIPLYIGADYLAVNQYITRKINIFREITSVYNGLEISDVNVIQKGASDCVGMNLYGICGLGIPTFWGMKY